MNCTRFFLITIVGMGMLLSSCRRDTEQMDSVAYEHSFSVIAELQPIDIQTDTKGYLGSYITANWTKNDKLSVVNISKGKILGGELIADRDGTSATFSGTVSGVIGVGDVIALCYPSFEVSKETDFGTQHLYIEKQNASQNVPLVAYSTFTAQHSAGQFSALELKFIYGLSYLKLNMANLPANADISRITLRNIPSSMSVSINSEKDGFTLGTSQEKAAKGKIEVIGSFKSSEIGTLMTAVGVLPAKESNDRSVIVSVDGYGEYLAALSSAEFEQHKYYNTIASNFECIALPGIQQYGIYDIQSGKTINTYEEFASTLIQGTEEEQADFTMLNTSTSEFWTLKGIPADAKEGTKFSASASSYGIGWVSSLLMDDATVMLIEPDGEYSKMWIKSKDMIFIVRR